MGCSFEGCLRARHFISLQVPSRLSLRFRFECLKVPVLGNLLTDGEEMAPALLSFIFLFPVLIIWSAFKPHMVKPELCEQPDLLTKAMSNIIAQYSYKLNY